MSARPSRPTSWAGGAKDSISSTSSRGWTLDHQTASSPTASARLLTGCHRQTHQGRMAQPFSALSAVRALRRRLCRPGTAEWRRSTCHTTTQSLRSGIQAAIDKLAAINAADPRQLAAACSCFEAQARLAPPQGGMAHLPVEALPELLRAGSGRRPPRDHGHRGRRQRTRDTVRRPCEESISMSSRTDRA